ncbi:unnamed protein product [Rhizoctonia solani]|uniref:DRBM domain-containing protein n=1 Tax=Rhizoctonia solani TaxID=456999 RepID=A0A8H3GX21_9AGAM|nr:unnamed protein product [Rhizoctonia solani]
MQTQSPIRPEGTPAPNSDQENRAALRLVNDFAHSERIVIDYRAEQRGPDDNPLWVVTPVIMGKTQGDLQGSGKKKKDAENTCALAVWNSGRL